MIMEHVMRALGLTVSVQCCTFNQARGIFGFSGESSIGQIGFPPIQVRRHATVMAERVEN